MVAYCNSVNVVAVCFWLSKEGTSGGLVLKVPVKSDKFSTNQQQKVKTYRDVVHVGIRAFSRAWARIRSRCMLLFEF